MKKKKTVIPDPLYEDIKAYQVVLFAGAGVTTEGGIYGSPTFYEIIHRKAKYSSKKSPPAFPDLMQFYCEKVDGGQRNRLTREILSRIFEFSAPGEKNNEATHFPIQVAEFPQFDRIVTTNWDPFFERSLNILVPMIEDRDLAFWNDQNKQILKIHGCVTRPYTLVATRDDYKSCIQRYPLIFNKLRDLMVAKTFVFVGYGLKDEDFRLIFEEITFRLGSLRKLAYAYDPNASDDSIQYWKEHGVTIIKEFGIVALEELRNRLEKDGLKTPRKFISFLHHQADRILKIHFKGNNLSSTGSFFSAMYQDGLLHALSQIFNSYHLGSRIDFLNEEKTLRVFLKKLLMHKDVVEFAYITGYLEIVKRFNALDYSRIPIYFDVSRIRPTNTFKAYREKALRMKDSKIKDLMTKNVFSDHSVINVCKHCHRALLSQNFM